jgi:hypothetical protein
MWDFLAFIIPNLKNNFLKFPCIQFFCSINLINWTLYPLCMILCPLCNIVYPLVAFVFLFYSFHLWITIPLFSTIWKVWVEKEFCCSLSWIVLGRVCIKWIHNFRSFALCSFASCIYGTCLCISPSCNQHLKNTKKHNLSLDLIYEIYSSNKIWSISFEFHQIIKT